MSTEDIWKEPRTAYCDDDGTRYGTGEEMIAKIKELTGERDRLREEIRKHRDQRGDDRCWMDDEALYAALPEGYVPPARDSAVKLKNCERFIRCRHIPKTEYVSPEREIERLREALQELATWVDGPPSLTPPKSEVMGRVLALLVPTA